jgi:hypothetical protein
VLPERGLARAGRGDEQDLLGILERLGEARRIVEVAVPHADAPLREAHGLPRITDADPDPFRGHALQQPLDDGAPESAGGSGDDDHDTSVLH